MPRREQPAALVAHFGEETKLAATELTYQLRAAGYDARLAFARGKRSLKSQMREANRHDVKYTIIVGDSELEKGVVTVRRMDDGNQESVPMNKLVEWMQN